ncbi:glycosyltransferase family 2 protein [Shewanella baltica]|uniref:glycosyltransferase family 2 protein n=1 Tax=Shewanella baltica TaxID=62322 RepID=UPI000D36EDA3|nr:glycosyltransferase family 2 protein [Shewanella baltica]
MTIDKNTVSVAIVTWNRKLELLKSVESLLLQSILPKEIIIVNNNSDYDVEASLSDFRTKSENLNIPLVIINTHTNLGCPMARNIAFANCSGDYIYALDDDGWLDEKAIEKCLDIFISYQDNNLIVVASSIICPISNDVIGNKSNGVEQKNLFCAAAALYRKSYILNDGFFPDYFRQMEESHFSLKAYSMAKKIFVNSDSLMYHHKTISGRVNYIEVSNNYINEIKNIKELVALHGAYLLFGYKSYAHFKSYFKSGEIMKFPLDFVRALFVLFFFKSNPKLSLKSYINFKKNISS